MGSPRIRRLIADYHALMDEFTGHPHVTVAPGRGDPPEEYTITYRVPGLVPGANGGPPQVSNLHKAMIRLTADYPRLKPHCQLLSPAFHPNFGAYICVGDHWAAGETIVDLVVKIGDMLQYRVYNVRSALNINAANWAVKNASRFPIGNVNLYAPEPEIVLDGEDEARASHPQKGPLDWHGGGEAVEITFD